MIESKNIVFGFIFLIFIYGLFLLFWGGVNYSGCKEEIWKDDCPDGQYVLADKNNPDEPDYFCCMRDYLVIPGPNNTNVAADFKVCRGYQRDYSKVENCSFKVWGW